jgi:hypothetical protein
MDVVQRRLALIAMWLVATIAATFVVWLGVRVVDGQVTGEPPLALAEASPGASGSANDVTTSTTLPGATTETTVATSAPGGPSVTGGSGTTPPSTKVTQPPPTTPASSPTTAAASQTRTANGQGGSVTVRTTATTVELVVATPNGGFETEIDKQGPGEVRVFFSSDQHVTEIRAFPGNAAIEVRESNSDDGSGHG